jgi:hypothetical protein
LRGRIVSTARSTSSIVPPPVETNIGRPIFATYRRSGTFVRSPEAILNAGIPSSARKSALASSKTVPKSVMPSSFENSRSSSQSDADSSSASRCSP